MENNTDVLNSDKVLINVVHTSQKIDHTTSSSFLGACATVKEVGSDLVGAFEGGQIVMSLLPDGASDIILDGAMICKKPPELDLELAVKFAESYHVAYTAARAYEDQLQQSASGTSSDPTFPDILILVTGGETAVGAIICLLLKKNHPDAKLFVTVDLSQHDDLVKCVGQYVLVFGAHYAINANAIDTIEHLQSALQGYTGKKKFGGIIDVTGYVQRVPDIMNALEERHVFVDTRAVSVGDPRDIIAPLRKFIDVNASCLKEL